MKKLVVLAYSGGLDTSYCISYLSNERNLDVHAIHVDTGGFDTSELEELKQRAYALGAVHFQSIQQTDTYYSQCIKYLLFGNVLRNDAYPASVSSERIFQAIAICQYANKVSAGFLAHGSTGAGNDQIRFDLIFQTLSPDIEIIAPIRELKLSRETEVNFLKTKGFDWIQGKKSYSINKGLWGTTIGGKETLSSHLPLPENAYTSPLIATENKKISIGFDKGEAKILDGVEYKNPVHLIEKLNEMAAEFAIGRDIHVGDTGIGIKGRVAFEAPAALILIKAHQLLEKHTLSKWQAYWKKQLGEWYGMMMHEGQFLDPVMRNIEKFLEDSQEKVCGDVFIELKPYHFQLEGIRSENDLMQARFGVYGEENKSWSGNEAKAFIKLMATPHKIYHELHKGQ